MRYMLLIYENEAERAARSPSAEATLIAGHRELIRDLEHAGTYESSDRLDTTDTATTVRVRSGKMTVTDGPFAETKEHMVGFYLISARDLDDAITIAARIPTAAHGSIEIRPVRVLPFEAEKAAAVAPQ